MNVDPIQDKPQDLSMNKTTVSEAEKLRATAGFDRVKDISSKTKSSIQRTTSCTTGKKVKHIPPPLDLAACNLENSNEAPTDLRTPKSPGDMPRECLPLRKRLVVQKCCH